MTVVQHSGDLLSELPNEFLARMRLQLGDSACEDFLRAYNRPPSRGVRVNTLRLSPSAFQSISPWEITPTDVIDEGFIIDSSAAIGKHPYHCAGLIYSQEPSAMSVIGVMDIEGIDEPRILDLCAAPGGKASGAAARMNGHGIIIANEIVRSRAAMLARNFERMGIANAAVTSAHPDAFARELPNYFDRVIVDAPCSGEGMFRKDPSAIKEWSPEHVCACAARQRAILNSASECVALGGKLIYSTCTFSIDENESVVESFLTEHTDFSLDMTARLYPHTSVGEGHFVARLSKNSGAERTCARAFSQKADAAARSAVDSFFLDTLSEYPQALTAHGTHTLRVFGESVYAVPNEMPAAITRLNPLAAGVEICALRKNRAVPSHTFFMSCLEQHYINTSDFAVGSRELTLFMCGNTIDVPESWHGFIPVRVIGGDAAYTVGFGKAVNGTLKNHLPKGLYVL